MECTRFPSGREQRVDRVANGLQILAVPDTQSGVVHVHGVGLLVVAETILHVQIKHPFPQPHRRVAEHRRVHLARPIDRRAERQSLENVPLEVDPWCHFGQRQSRSRQTENAAFGHVQHLLPGSPRIVGAERDLPDALDELRVPAFLHDPDPAIVDHDLEPAGTERAHEHDFFRVLADVDEAAAPGNALAEFAGVHVTRCIALSETEEGRIESAAVDEIERTGVIDDRLVVDGRSEVETAHRHTADDTRVHGERQQVRDALLCRDQGHLIGDRADAHVDDAVRSKLEHGPTRDDFPVGRAPPGGPAREAARSSPDSAGLNWVPYVCM